MVLENSLGNTQPSSERAGRSLAFRMRNNGANNGAGREGHGVTLITVLHVRKWVWVWFQ